MNKNKYLNAGEHQTLFKSKNSSQKQSGWSTRSKNNGEGTSGDLLTYSNVIVTTNRVLSPSFSTAE